MGGQDFVFPNNYHCASFLFIYSTREIIKTGWFTSFLIRFNRNCKWMASVPSGQPSAVTKQQGSRSEQDLDASGNRCSGGVYYNDYQLPQGYHRYGTYILTLVQAGPMQLCKNIYICNPTVNIQLLFKAELQKTRESSVAVGLPPKCNGCLHI